MDFRSSNYSSDNQGKDGFSRSAPVAGSNHLNICSGGTPSAALSHPSYSYRPASSGAGNSYYRPRVQERYLLKKQPPQQDIYVRREEERLHSSSLHRTFGDPASSAPMPGCQQAVSPKAVNPFDHYGGFLDEPVPAPTRNLGYHPTWHASSDSVPSMVESEMSENDDQYSTEDGNNSSGCFYNNQGEHEQRTMGTNWYYHAPQQHHSTFKPEPLLYKQPPPLPPPGHQQLLQHRALKKPPPHNTSVASASSPASRGARLRENNFSFKLLEISPGEHIRLRGARETWHAIEHDFFMPCGCVCCSDTIFCIQDANFVLCPDCKVISPLQGDGKDGGVGLGFKMEDLAKWQNQITRTHQRSHSNLW